MMGSVRHNGYLSHWQIDAALFPKGVDWLLIYGAYGLLERTVTIAKLATESWLVVAIGLVVLATYIFILLTPLGDSTKPKLWLRAHRPWIARLIESLMWSSVIAAFSWILLIAIVLLIGVPGLAGEISGRTSADQDALEFAKGCAASKPRCVTLLRDDKPIAHGYLLDSSPEHIALFDVDLKQARAIPRDGLELRSDPERTTLAAGAASAASQP